MNIFTESIDLNNCILIQTDDINLNDIQYKEPEETEVIDIINDDSKNTVFTCRFCNETFLKWITFKRHEANHKKEKKFKCDECSTSFNILTNLTLHKAIHNKNETKCPECDKVFARVASLRAHLLLHEKDESISCPECQKPFDTELQLESHMKSHEKKKMLIEDNLKCKLCNRDFTNATEHKLHMHNHNKMKHLLFSFPHKNTGGKNRKSRTRYAHACNDCLKTFQKRSQLVRHMRVHSGEKPFQCQLCNHAFSQSNTLKIHMSKHTGVRPFKCSLCPGTFSQKGNLRVHIHRVHSIPREENAFHCTECACAFRRLSALNAHINRVHGDTPTTFDPSKGYPPNVTILNGTFSNDVHESGTNDKSGQDGFKYITLADTDVEGIVKRYYIRQRKIENVRWLRCTYCTKEFKKPSDVVRHIRTHTREKPFQCIKCGRGFAVKSTLTTHMRTHTNEKVYNCALCEKSFSSSSSLQAHIRRHTGIKKSYQCNSCPNTYNTPEQLKIHSMIHAREEQKKENIEPNAVPQVQLKDPIFITDRGSRLYCTSAKTKLLRTSKTFRAHTCQTCGSSFRRSGHLKQHLRMHSNDRPYSCPKCERTFKSSTVLNTHIKTHDGIKSFHCTECSGAFTTKGSLRRHMTRHSSRRPYMCPYCKKMFKTLQNCRKHIKSHRSEISVEICEEKRKLQQGPLVSVLKNTNVNFGEISVLDNLSFDKNIQTNSISNIIVYDPVANIHDLIQNNNANGQIICQLLTADNTISLANALNEPHPQQNVFEFNDPSKQEQLELINQEDKCHSMTITKELLTTLDPSIKNIQLPVFHHEFDPKLCTQQINLVPSSNSDDNAENFEIISQEIPNMLYTQNAVTVQNDDCIYINTDEISENVPNLNTVSPVYPVDKPEINPRMTKRPNRRLRILKQRTKHKPTVEESDNKDKNHNKSESKIDLNKNNFVNNIDNEYFINSSNIDNVKKYICSTCSKGFRKPSDLERHIRTHTGERPFRCEKCGKSFSLKSTLKSHMKIHSSVLKKFTCPECDCLFSTKGSLKVHIRIHTGSKPFQCPYCPMRFRTSGHRQTHCQVHLKEAERANNLNNNFKKTKKSVKTPTSNKTNFETNEINNLTSVENIQPVQTEESSNIYYTLSDNQSNAINLDMLNAFPETILENIHQPEQDASILEQLENGGLLIHDVFNNTDQSWYDVEMYESGQIINVHLTSNSKTVSDEISGELEAAIPCSVEFVQDPNNPTDVEAESSDVLESSRSVQNICYYCKKGFEKPSKLERHLRVHTGDRPFVCSVCKKAFTQMNSLNAHMRTHSGNKPFKCSYCDHSTAQKGNLNIHLMKIHGISGNQIGVLKTPILEEIEQKLNEHIQQ